MVRDRSRFDASFARRIPGVGAMASGFARVAERRAGRVPVGLLALLPVALLIDVFDAADELALGPIGMAASFLVESAFLLGVTGRASYAFGFAGIDLVPGVDVLPFATITLAGEILRAWRDAPRADGKVRPDGPVIDV